MTRRGLALSVGAVACCILLGAQAVNKVVRTFNPPRAAVVDRSEIFDNYEKKNDRQAQLKIDTEALESKLKELEKRYRDLLDELPHIEPGSEQTEKQIEKLKLELEVKELKQRELKRIRDKQVAFLREISEEIKKEIQEYAQAQDLDLVLERNVSAEGDGTNPGFHWPIVHFAKPELDITAEITERLNSRYRKPADGNASR